MVINGSNTLAAKQMPNSICHLLFRVISSPFIWSATLQKHIMTKKHADHYFMETF